MSIEISMRIEQEKREFAQLVETMRTQQKGFFKSVYGSPERTAFLNNSKTAEKLVDEAVKKILNRKQENKLF